MKKIISITLLSFLGSTIMALPTKQQATPTSQPAATKAKNNISSEHVINALTNEPNADNYESRIGTLDQVAEAINTDPSFFRNKAEESAMKNKQRDAVLLLGLQRIFGKVVSDKTPEQLRKKKYFTYAALGAFGCSFVATGIYVLTKEAAKEFSEKALLSAMVSCPIIAAGALIIANLII